MARSILFGTALLATAAVAHAQATGIRVIFPEFTQTTREGNFKRFLLGGGLDHDLNDRLSLGLDVLFDPTGSDYSGEEIQVTSGAYVANYDLSAKTLAIAYRAVYAFSDNDETHVYLGSSIGYRKLKQTVNLAYVDGPTYDNGPFQQRAEGSVSVIPVGLRLGVAGGLEGGYGDLYLSAMYGIGSNKSGFSQSFFSGDEFKPASFILTIGLAYGIGW